MNNDPGTVQQLPSASRFTHLHRFTQQLPVATVLLGDSGRHIEHVNPAFLQLFNQEIIPATGVFGDDIFPDLYNPFVQQAISKASLSGIAVKEQGVKIIVGMPGGVAYKYLDFHAAPVSDDEGNPTAGILLTILDTTRETESRKQFGESERSYRSLMESMAVAVYTCDMEGKVNFYNDAAVVLWGRVPKLGVELWCGSHKMYTLDGNWMPHDQCPAAISLKEMRAVKAEALVQRPDGNMRHVLVFPRPEYDMDGKAIGLINAVVDITERKALERQKDDFMGIVAHELKTPVTSIKGFAQILMRRLSKLGDEKFMIVQGRMETQLNNLTKLIDRMLNAAKIESGELEFKKERFDLALLLHDVVENVQLTIITHQLMLNPGEGIFVEGDKELTEQVIINLLSNAIKYSPKANKVYIAIHQENNRAVCSFRDLGSGIPAEQTDSIFEKFYRVKTENLNRFPGLGLGLYLSAEIIRQQGGAIWVESVVDEGSKFSFSLLA